MAHETYPTVAGPDGSPAVLVPVAAYRRLLKDQEKLKQLARLRRSVQKGLAEAAAHHQGSLHTPTFEQFLAQL
ncbi:MAG: hypothetical protein SFY70_07115 [Bacteroidia bacterium]|nr:hypothetical protein [Bacteroidia bacterium]